MKNCNDKITIHPGLLSGSVTLPISKSITHRVLLGMALQDNQDILNVNLTNVADDIVRTLNGAKELYRQKLRLQLQLQSQSQLQVQVQSPLKLQSNISQSLDFEPCKIYCKDSGTTLRMILPIACALFSQVEISFTEALSKRPLEPLMDVLQNHGCEFHKEKNNNGSHTLHCKGQFKGGDCYIAGNVSSQFISGLLYALPISKKGGTIHLTTSLASKPYVDMTLAILKDFGIKIYIYEKNGLLVYKIPGKQKFKNTQVNFSQGDWSSAAFFAVANALGSQVEMTNLTDNSLQGDREIYSFINTIQNSKNPILDLENHPDLFPILAIFASYKVYDTKFTGIKRLRLKESDRIAATEAMLSAMGGKLSLVSRGCDGDDYVVVKGMGHLSGGVIDSFQDHRIAMAAAIGATRADGDVTILNNNCCKKSYPDFFKDYARLGGKID